MFNRIHGWKDIAKYFGRGVRTVQRWEAELGLPVRRVRAKTGDTVYAEKPELDGWLAARGRELDDNGSDPRGSDVHLAEAPPRRPGSIVLGLISLSVLAALVLSGVVYGFRPIASGLPTWCRVENNALMVYGSDNRLLWQHVFTEVLQPEFGPYSEITDLDGDGLPEVLFLAKTRNPYRERFYCFNHDGSLRFQESSVGPIRFGAVTYDPPFAPRSLRTIAEPDGTRSVWLLRIHWEMFPSLAQRISPHGKVLSEYWNNGHLRSVSEAWIGGQRVVLLGGLSNEMKLAAALVALPYERASGSTPAGTQEFRCSNCPAGSPLYYRVFPRMEVSTVGGGSAQVVAARQVSDGSLHVEIHQLAVDVRPDARVVTFPVFYDLDNRFNPIRAQFGNDYKETLRRLAENRVLSRPLTKNPVDEMFPIMAWEGNRFVEVGQR